MVARFFNKVNFVTAAYSVILESPPY